MSHKRVETDSLGSVEVAGEVLWGAQTQRALNLFDQGTERMPQELVEAYAFLKKGCALANCSAGHLSQDECSLIVQVCDEILEGDHINMFPLPVWISGSGTQFNMNVNEVISNRCSQLAGMALGSKKPVHPNDHVNYAQSTNDNFPSAMYIATALGVTRHLLPTAREFAESLHRHAVQWSDVVKIGRTHMQDATPLTLGQEFSGYSVLIEQNITRIEAALGDVFALPLGGTAVGTGINAYPGFDKEAIGHIATMTQLPFFPAVNKFAVQGSHDALVHLSGCLKGLANSLYKIANDIRLLSCGPRAGIGELVLPANEPGSSIMPGKVNPTQCESMTMVAIQVIAADQAVTHGGCAGSLEMNVYKPLIIYNIMNSIRTLSGSMRSFKANVLDGLTADLDRIEDFVNRSLMLVTALSPVIGYEKSAQIAQEAHRSGSTLKEAALKLGFVTEDEFERIVVPRKMVRPQV